MATLHGRNAHVYLQGSGSEAVPLTEAHEFTIDVDFDTEPDTAFGDTWESHLRGIYRWSGSIMVNHDTAQSTIFDASTQGTPRKAYFYPDRSSATQYYYGTIWPRQSLNVPFGVAKATCNFQGSGQLAQN